MATMMTSHPAGSALKRSVLDRARQQLRYGDRLLAAADPADPRDLDPEYRNEDRYRDGYHAALRGAAAVLALSEGARVRGSRSAWVRLAKAAPSFGGWIDIFGNVAATNAAIEMGLPRRVDDAELQALLAQVRAFLADVDLEIDRMGGSRAA